uniref:Uncharacterized protein n=1 Tax=Oryza barthii TaxID=65489 RepID=A0A0D3ELV8_9ORYZ
MSPKTRTPVKLLGREDASRSSLLLRSGLSDAALFSRLIPAPAPSSARVRVRDSKSRWSDFSTPALASHRLRSARQQGLCREEKVELWKVIAGSFGSFFEDFSNCGVSMCDTSRFFQLHFASSVCVNDSEVVELLGTCNLFSTIFCGSVDVHCLIYWY